MHSQDSALVQNQHKLRLLSYIVHHARVCQSKIHVLSREPGAHRHIIPNFLGRREAHQLTAMTKVPH
eukprot:9787331-Prorocentrum_lima.AAC.1